MMNNLQKDLKKNTEKYNKSHQHYKKVKAINCQYCYPISKDANVPKNFIKFWDWLTLFHLAKTYTSLTLFYFERVIKAKARRNKNAIISNISELYQTIIFDPIPTKIDDIGNTIENILHFRNNFDEKDIKTPKSSPSILRSKSPKLIKLNIQSYQELQEYQKQVFLKRLLRKQFRLLKKLKIQKRK